MGRNLALDPDVVRAKPTGGAEHLPEPWRTAVLTLLRESGCTIRRWRKAYTGRAYTREADWGIESPQPRGAKSFGIFAHEVAHQMLHRTNGKPRWQEEIEAWNWALACFDRFGLPGREPVELWAHECVRYALAKARRRAKTDATRAAIDAAETAWREAA